MLHILTEVHKYWVRSVAVIGRLECLISTTPHQEALVLTGFVEHFTILAATLTIDFKIYTKL